MLQSVDKGLDSQLANEILHTEEVGTEAFSVIVGKESDQPVSVGMYTIRWRRQKRFVKSQIILASFFLITITSEENSSNFLISKWSLLFFVKKNAL
jgi:hypothetical protein